MLSGAPVEVCVLHCHPYFWHISAVYRFKSCYCPQRSFCTFHNRRAQLVVMNSQVEHEAIHVSVSSSTEDVKEASGMSSFSGSCDSTCYRNGVDLGVLFLGCC